MSSPALVIFATAWGARHGGVNSFNMELCTALVRVVENKYKIICIVPGVGSETQAVIDGVEVVSLLGSGVTDQLEVNRAYEVVKRLENNYKVLWWIGHDVITGPIAFKASELAGGKVAVIHHMNYAAYKSYTGINGAQLQKTIEDQRALIRAADRVLAVGPKLAKSARKMRDSDGINSVTELVPGLALMQGLEVEEGFSAITFGRLDRKTDRLKLARLAVAAFGRASGQPGNPLGYDATMTVIGVPDDSGEDGENTEVTELRRIAEEQAQRAVVVNVFPFLDDRDRLLDELRHHSVCLMLSLHEGFGLVGWEAIAAEVPLILSRNSGLYEFIDRNLEGLGTGLVQGVDIQGKETSDIDAVVRSLLWIRSHGPRAKSDAKKLKKLLSKLCTWEDTAGTLVEALGLELGDTVLATRVSRWNVDIMVEALTHSPDLVDQMARRIDVFQQFWDKMKPPSSFTKRLVLFGGISTALCDENAVTRYVSWLKSNPQSRMYICYETGAALLARANQLNPDRLETESGLPGEATPRLVKKERNARSLRDQILARAGGDVLDARVIAIPLPEPMTTYIMIADDQVYLTPLLETRSTETLSFALAGRARQFRNDVAQYIYYYLNAFQPTPDAEALMTDLRSEVSLTGVA